MCPTHLTVVSAAVFRDDPARQGPDEAVMESSVVKRPLVASRNQLV
jgi:hypothetical protein